MARKAQCEGQLTFDFDPIEVKAKCQEPGNCPHEASVVDGKKSYCEAWERWTNCREAGRCLLADDKEE